MARQQKTAIVEIQTTVVPEKSLFERVKRYLDADDWNFTAVEENGYFTMGCRIKDANPRQY